MISSCAGLDDVQVATAAAHAGADVVRSMYGRRLTRLDKGAGDFATAAEVEAEKTILGVIRAARPDDAVLGEEGGQQGAADATRQWLVDPLCGTLNYAVGNMLVAVNVALCNGRRRWPTRSAARSSSPTVRARGCGTKVSTLSWRPRPPPDLWMSTWTRRSPAPRLPGCGPAVPARLRRILPSTGRLHEAGVDWVAAGKRAAYVTDGGDLSGSVHFAAGIALCQAAGCIVTGIYAAPGRTVRLRTRRGCRLRSPPPADVGNPRLKPARGAALPACLSTEAGRLVLPGHAATAERRIAASAAQQGSVARSPERPAADSGAYGADMAG